MNEGPAILGTDEGPWSQIGRCLVLAPHPDDFDVVAVAMRALEASGAELVLEVLTSGASGVEDRFAGSWEEKTAAREDEQRASCQHFGLPVERIRFHRLEEDDSGHMVGSEDNEDRVWSILDRVAPDAVVLPHGSDSNADHRRTFRMFDRWARERECATLALLVRDPKTLDMRLDLISPFDDTEGEWKAGMLRCHASQQERNVRSRGYGLDERILRVNREIAAEAGIEEPFAEGFEVNTYQGEPAP